MGWRGVGWGGGERNQLLHSVIKRDSFIKDIHLSPPIPAGSERKKERKREKREREREREKRERKRERERKERARSTASSCNKYVVV